MLVFGEAERLGIILFYVFKNKIKIVMIFRHCYVKLIILKFKTLTELNVLNGKPKRVYQN